MFSAIPAAQLLAFFATLKRKQLVTNPKFGGDVYATLGAVGLLLRIRTTVHISGVVGFLKLTSVASAFIWLRFQMPRSPHLLLKICYKLIPAGLFLCALHWLRL
jgi:hypothetical protein